MIVNTEALVINYTQGSIDFVKLLTPYGKFLCYINKPHRLPSFRKVLNSKTCFIKVKIYFRTDYFMEITKFPGEILEVEKVKRYSFVGSQKETLRGLVDYMFNLIDNFSLLGSGEGFCESTKKLLDFMEKIDREEAEKNILSEALTMTVEGFLFKAEGLLPEVRFCPDIHSKPFLLFLPESLFILCPKCFVERNVFISENTESFVMINRKKALKIVNFLKFLHLKDLDNAYMVLTQDIEREGELNIIYLCWKEYLLKKVFSVLYEVRVEKLLKKRPGFGS
ncbi:MAG: hypothetical protein QXI31_00010 [Archaeoglobaceae archaeon]